MHIAIAVGTLLLGGWALETPEETNEPAVLEQTASSATVPPAVAPATPRMLTPSMGVSAYQGLQGVRAMQRGQSLGRAPGVSVDGLRGQLRGNQVTPAYGGRLPLMPLPPTQPLPLGAWAVFGQPAVATLPTNTMGMATNVSGGGARAQGLNVMATTSGFGGGGATQPQSGYRSTSYGLDQSRAAQPIANSVVRAPPVQQSGQKAFAGYQPPGADSLNMNLSRTGTDNGTIVNYMTLGRRQLTQQYLNQQYRNQQYRNQQYLNQKYPNQQNGLDIRGLQSDTRLQNQALTNQSRQLQGVSSPQFYMNYGGYYNFPGSGRPNYGNYYYSPGSGGF
jgi:hypothetical protein